MQSVMNFFRTRDWKLIFLRLSTFLFWFHLFIFFLILFFQPIKDMFWGWAIRENKDYFLEKFIVQERVEQDYNEKEQEHEWV